MPTYTEALVANPTAFVDYATQMTSAGTDLTEHRAAYGEEVAKINGHWQDEANAAFNGDVTTVATHIDGLATQTAGTAAVLSAAGAGMQTSVTILQTADAALRAAGFDILPEPKVVLGPAQLRAIAMAGTFGPQLRMALEATAYAATLGLKSVLAALESTDVQTAAALNEAANSMQPLKTMTSTTEDEQHREAEDHSGEDGPAEDEESEAPPELPQQPEDPQRPTQPQAPQTPQQPTVPQMPTAPQTPSDLGDLQRPELGGEWDGGEWDDAEAPDPDDVAGGLASGGLGAGGLGGGGLGAGGLSTGGTGPGGGLATGAGTGTGAAAGTALGATAGRTAPTAAKPGGTGRSGMGPAMMGAGGARGAGGADDDETARESQLVEDPEEDVWGIGGGDDDPYA